MTKNQRRLLAVLAIIFIAFSIVAFALPFKMNDMFWLSYLFGILSIAIQIYVLRVAFNGANTITSKFYGFPIVRIGFIYMCVQLALSFIFMALAAIAPIWLALILYVIALAASAVGFIGSDAARDEVERQEIKLEADTSCMLALRSTTASLAEKCSDSDAKNAVAELADEFRYSDPVSNEALMEIESELKSAVTELQKSVSIGGTAQIIEKVKRTSELLAKRNQFCKQHKRK